MKQLKEIIKKHKLGKVSKKKKAQLIGLISNCDTCKDILSKLNLPPKKAKKPPSAKQKAAREKFKAMVSNKKQEVKPKPSLEKKGISELIDIGLDKGLKVNDNMTKQQLVNAVSGGVKSLKQLHQKDLAVRKTKPVKSEKKKAALKEINDMMKNLITIEEDKIANVKVIEKIGKKKFLDAIFGENAFNLKREIKDIVNEAKDEQLEIFLSFSKAKKKELLKKRFDSSKSIGELLNSFIK